jgi:hypothetical protein
MNLFTNLAQIFKAKNACKKTLYTLNLKDIDNGR